MNQFVLTWYCVIPSNNQITARDTLLSSCLPLRGLYRHRTLGQVELQNTPWKWGPPSQHTGHLLSWGSTLIQKSADNKVKPGGKESPLLSLRIWYETKYSHSKNGGTSNCTTRQSSINKIRIYFSRVRLFKIASLRAVIYKFITAIFEHIYIFTILR
jgi:hypothetical protein